MAESKLVPQRLVCSCGTDRNDTRRIYFPEFASCAASASSLMSENHRWHFEDIVPQVRTDTHTPAPQIHRRETY